MSPKNRLKITACFIVVLMCSYTFNAPCFAFEDEGFQYWASSSASFNISKNWEGTLQKEFRLGDNGGTLYYQHSELGLRYKGFADWLELGLNYRQIFERDDKRVWKLENRPHLNITLKGRLSELNVSNRSRFEYRIRENKDDLWRYRDKVTVKLPYEFTGLKLKPYLANEVFITLDDYDYNKNRLYSGITFALFKENIKADIFYLWQSSKSSSGWKDIHALGTGLKIRF